MNGVCLAVVVQCTIALTSHTSMPQVILHVSTTLHTLGFSVVLANHFLVFAWHNRRRRGHAKPHASHVSFV
jgi:hypothetical protein